jgi:hypothetical protein
MVNMDTTGGRAIDSAIVVMVSVVKVLVCVTVMALAVVLRVVNAVRELDVLSDLLGPSFTVRSVAARGFVG